jgi:hypothetical protein
LGKPIATITAVVESKRYDPPEQMQTIYSRGTIVFLNAKIVGNTGVEYSQFTVNQNYKIAAPKMKLLDPTGNKLVVKTLEYG